METLEGRRITRARSGDLPAFVVLTLGALAMIGPFIWMISTSLEPLAERYDMALIPQSTILGV